MLYVLLPRALLCFENNHERCYQVIAAAQAGKHTDKRESFGETLIIDPWGTIVGRLPGENYVIPISWCFVCWSATLKDIQEFIYVFCFRSDINRDCCCRY